MNGDSIIGYRLNDLQASVGRVQLRTYHERSNVEQDQLDAVLSDVLRSLSVITCGDYYEQTVQAKVQSNF